MCMQPWFFSIGRWHFGQGLVFARIQLRFSDSALFLVIQRRTVSHDTGRCASSLQLKQNAAPHVHTTSSGSSGARSSAVHSTAFSQPLPVHHDMRRLSSTNERTANSSYLASWGGGTHARTSDTGTSALRWACERAQLGMPGVHDRGERGGGCTQVRVAAGDMTHDRN